MRVNLRTESYYPDREREREELKLKLTLWYSPLFASEAAMFAMIRGFYMEVYSGLCSAIYTQYFPNIKICQYQLTTRNYNSILTVITSSIWQTPTLSPHPLQTNVYGK